MCASEADTGGFRQMLEASGRCSPVLIEVYGSATSQTPTGAGVCFGMARRCDYIGSSDRVWSQRAPQEREFDENERSPLWRSEHPPNYLTDHVHPAISRRSLPARLNLPEPVSAEWTPGFLFKIDSGCSFIRTPANESFRFASGPPYAWTRAYASIPDHKS
jgi:hypothetical protein